MSEQEEDWPYEKIEAVTPDEAPSWLCPDDKCTCAEKEEKPEPYTCAIMCCAPDGKRMSGARCRVVVNGILANEDNPNADASGWISVELARAPETMHVEWAPADTPLRSDLPYRRRYYVNLCEGDPAEATRRRLHNLGFSVFDTLRENIQDFQCEYDQRVTGEIEDVEAILKAYHDAAMLPVTRDKSSANQPSSPRGFQLVSGNALAAPDNNVAQAPPAAAPADGPTGTVKPIHSKATNLPSVLDIIDQKKHTFEWVAITISDGGFDGIFWVFKDALKEKSSGRRWPTTAHEQQLACDKIRSTPADLPGWPSEAITHGGSLESFFLTPKLMDMRWAQAERAGQAIDPQPQNVNADTAVENDKLNKGVDAAMQPGWMAADPGKIWAIASRMKGVVIGGLPAAINYGWHLPTSKISISKSDPKKGTWNGTAVQVAVTGVGQWCLQWEEMGHNTAWIDYSQLMILVSGWCAIRSAGGAPFAAEQTEDVYKHPQKAALVTADKQPLTLTRQEVPTTPAQKKTAAKETQLQKDLAERQFRLARIEERVKQQESAPGQGQTTA